jgi:predicted regulator of Ras-like GTPase activity (Roadblock/LC7/MglB family)
LRSLVLVADFGKVFLHDLGIGFLVVITQQDTALGSAEVEVKSAARKLVKMARLTV